MGDRLGNVKEVWFSGLLGVKSAFLGKFLKCDKGFQCVETLKIESFKSSMMVHPLPLYPNHPSKIFQELSPVPSLKS